MSAGTVDDLRFDSAEEFLAALGPSQVRWQPDPRRWIFRGHANSTWPLFAKAYRVQQQPYAAFGVEVDLGGAQPWSAYAKAEREILERFGHALDRAGMPIPAVAVELERRETRMSDADTRPDNIPLLALAQHYGLPTKLLDWTRQSRVAAYFAAAEAAAGPKDGLDMAVWALRTDFVASIEHRAVDDAELSILTAPAATNPNLHAQQGLFTRVGGENAHLYPLDRFVSEAADAARAWDIKPWQRTEGRDPNAIPRPLMRRFQLPQAEAPKLLRLLAYEGVTGATMFPGYVGVVRGMQEEALWDLRQRQ